MTLYCCYFLERLPFRSPLNFALQQSADTNPCFVPGEGVCWSDCGTAHTWCYGECPSTVSFEERAFAIIFDLFHWDSKPSFRFAPILIFFRCLILSFVFKVDGRPPSCTQYVFLCVGGHISSGGSFARC